MVSFGLQSGLVFIYCTIRLVFGAKDPFRTNNVHVRRLRNQGPCVIFLKSRKFYLHIFKQIRLCRADEIKLGNSTMVMVPTKGCFGFVISTLLLVTVGWRFVVVFGTDGKAYLVEELDSIEVCGKNTAVCKAYRVLMKNWYGVIERRVWVGRLRVSHSV